MYVEMAAYGDLINGKPYSIKGGQNRLHAQAAIRAHDVACSPVSSLIQSDDCFTVSPFPT
jgi:hypothetical protein